MNTRRIDAEALLTHPPHDTWTPGWCENCAEGPGLRAVPQSAWASG